MGTGVAPVASRRFVQRMGMFDWLPLATLPAVALLVTPADWPRWGAMWLIAIAIFAGCKWLTWRKSSVQISSWWRHVTYFIAWPGLDADAFLGRRSASPPRFASWLIAAVSTLLGITLVYFSGAEFTGTPVMVRGWTGMVGLVLALHFGLFHLLSCVWRRVGVPARPVMRVPIAATSLQEFWGGRWNTAFRDLAHRFVFVPLSRSLGPRAAIVLTYLFSGVVHDLVITVPAGGGYGGPTGYFLLQSAGMFVERSIVGRRFGLADGLRGRLFTLVVVIGPVAMLFPEPFVTRVAWPFVAAVTTAVQSSLALPRFSLSELIFAAGVGQLGILVASALVPFQLKWREELRPLSRLHRQMYWVYGGYVVLSIVAFGLICLFNAGELANGSSLARAFCGYVAVFWGVRLALQAVLDVRSHLTTPWLHAGYHTLTTLFAALTTLFSFAAMWGG